tara:strand:+ start:2461 stop:2853 length:393 start_codon:yes stop_codon:yes gene_type:complete
MNIQGQQQGRVKWFNNKNGFGFITLIGDHGFTDNVDDIFVHHSAIIVSKDQYRYLVEGEYVSFTIETTDEGTHKYQASQVKGICGGMLMCETREENKQKTSNTGQQRSIRINNKPRVRQHGSGPRQTSVE